MIKPDEFAFWIVFGIASLLLIYIIVGHINYTRGEKAGVKAYHETCVNNSPQSPGIIVDENTGTLVMCVGVGQLTEKELATLHEKQKRREVVTGTLQ